MEHKDISNQENQKSRQAKPVIRRDKVVVTKVTAQELSKIKSTAEQCGMTRSDFIRCYLSYQHAAIVGKDDVEVTYFVFHF